MDSIRMNAEFPMSYMIQDFSVFVRLMLLIICLLWLQCRVPRPTGRGPCVARIGTDTCQYLFKMLGMFRSAVSCVARTFNIACALVVAIEGAS